MVDTNTYYYKNKDLLKLIHIEKINNDPEYVKKIKQSKKNSMKIIKKR